MNGELSLQAQRAIDLALKLLEVKGCSEAEAGARTAKAMELLAQHNLDIHAIERASGAGPAARKDKKRSGGLYKWQRDLWEEVAKLNFCVYRSIKGLTKGSSYEQRLIGRPENVISTEVMAEYLQETVEKHAQAWSKAEGYKSVFVKDAIAYREGMADRIAERLRDLRRDVEAKEAAKKAEDAMRAKHPGAASTGTALVLADVKQTEADLNQDYLNGFPLGTTAANRAKRELTQHTITLKWEFVKNNDRDGFFHMFGEEAMSWFDQEFEWREDHRKREEANREAQRIRAEKAEKRKQTMIANGTYREPKGRPEPIGRYSKGWEPRSATYYDGRTKGGEVNLDRQIDETTKRRLG